MGRLRRLDPGVRFWVLLLATVVVLLGASAFAQGIQTATIRGVLSSADARPLAGVVVTVKSSALQGQRTATTDADGAYVLASLPAGAYTATYVLSGMAPMERRVEAPLGGTAYANVTLQVAPIAESVTVTGEAPTALGTPTVGLNIVHETVESLPLSRTLAGVAELSPGLTNVVVQPGQAQLSISGAPGFDNGFLVNGVDVADNLFGGPQNLFIEDAIQEVQTLTSGIGAEYGRFSGGVVNAITKSGGNRFSGSFRTNFGNPAWSTETPFQRSQNQTNPSVPNRTYETTLGGPLVKDRLWFFGAGRIENTSQAQTLPQTGYAILQENKNRRGEIKLTGSPLSGHTIQGGYLNNSLKNTNLPSVPGLAIDRFSVLGSAEQPNWSYFTNYRGVVRSNLLVDLQYSQRKWGRVGGNAATNIGDSPFFNTDFTQLYNAPYFDSTDPEHRNNWQVTGSVMTSANKAGRHDLKSGYEWFRSQWAGGNTQSSTGYIFLADYATNAAGAPLLDAAGRIQPIFTRNGVILDRSIAQRDATYNIDTQSLYVQDHWTLNGRWSADLGARFEHAVSGTTSGIAGVSANAIVPRLGVTYDIKGDGNLVAQATYGHYKGRYNENQIAKNTLQGNTNDVVGIYVGPSGQGRGFAPGFDPANYRTVGGSFPTANVSLNKDLSTPLTREFTLSLGSAQARRAHVQGTYVLRKTSNLIEDSISLANGTTDVVQNGVDTGTFTNIVILNSDVARREYQALVLEGTYRVRSNWTFDGHYTAMLRDEGNYEGEAPNAPGQTSVIGNYPEILNEARHFPTGRLQDFQRHKLRIWSVYQMNAGRFGDVSFSGLWRVNSAQVYSLRSGGQPLSSVQTALLKAYPDSPQSQTIYFGARGAESFKGYGLFDVSVNYDVPVFKTLRPWVKMDVFNLFDNDKLIRWDTTVTPDPKSPVDSLGLPTGYVTGPRYGTAVSNASFPSALQGVTGGRTLRLAVGFRF
jgi:hypothetical protein